MIWMCRVLFLFVFALFWGGLTFYTGFVVRISHDVLADPMDGGMITQRVTMLLQYLGAACVTLMLINAGLVAKSSVKFGCVLLACTAVLACAVTGLFIVHGHLDTVIDINVPEITDREAFTIGHRRYNQLTTVQWISSTLYLPIIVAAWRRADS